MRSTMPVVLCLIFSISLAECYFEYIDVSKSLSDAVQDCNNRSLELLTLSTYRQYLDAQDYFNISTNSFNLLWLALEPNTTTGNYQWLNGRVLTELKWEGEEPTDHFGADCGVMNISSRLWYSELCTANRHYLCVGSESNYSVSSVSVDFYTAVINCQSEGRRLPVAITNLDTDWLNDVITSNSLSDDIWLGLIKSGTQYDDYYRWVTGEHLTPPYTWITITNDLNSTVHYHPYGNKGLFHPINKQENHYVYICQSQSEDTAVVRSKDKFEFVTNNAVVMGSVRRATTINSLRNFQCALECLKDAGCIQFTIQGYLCTTFGESLVITDYNEGHVLWQRKIIF